MLEGLAATYIVKLTTLKHFEIFVSASPVILAIVFQASIETLHKK